MHSSPDTYPQTTSRRRPWLCTALLVVLAVAAHGRSCWSDFIWDDEQYVTDNKTLRSLDGLRQIWLEPRSIPQYYPLVHTTFWIEHHLWGTAPAGYHLVNVVLHAVSSVLLWVLLLRLAVPGAWLAAAIFAVHPVGVETVSWVTERKNTLSMVFAVSAALAWLRYRFDQAGPRWLVAATLLFVGALLAKTVAAMLVGMLGVIVWWKTGRFTVRDGLALLPLVVVGLPLALFTVWLEKHHVGAIGSDFAFTPADRLLIAGRAACFYAAKLAWPQPLAFFYDRWTIDARQAWQWGFPLGVAVAIVGTWWQRSRIGRGPLAAILMFLCGLFPALGFFDVYPFKFSFVADHFSYHATPVWCAACAAGLTAIALRWKVDPVLPGAVVLAVLLPLAIARCGVFRNCETLWLDTLAKSPRCSAAANNLGAMYQLEDRLDEAIPLLQHASQTALFADARSQSLANLGMIYLRQGRPAEAFHVAQEAYRHNITTRSRVALALACVRTGRLTDAGRLVATAKPKDLDSADMKLVRAELSLRQGDEPAAKAHFTAYTDQEDRKIRNKALLEAGIVWLEQDRPAEAEALFAVIDADPKLTAKARLNLGISRARGNDLPAAITAFRGAIEADPDSAEAHGNLGRALLLSGDRVAALQHLTRSRTLSGRSFAFERELQEASREPPPTPAPDVSVPEVPLP